MVNKQYFAVVNDKPTSAGAVPHLWFNLSGFLLRIGAIAGDSDIQDSLSMVKLTGKVRLIFFPAGAPGGMPAPQARHQAFGVRFRLLPQWAAFAAKGFLFFGYVLRVHDISP